METLIQTACLTDKQMRVIRLLMQGFLVDDIAERLGCGGEAVNDHFKRAVLRISRKNNGLWAENASRMMGGAPDVEM